jgi:hypothetical protein
MERFDNRPNLSYSAVSDTSALPTDATTNHCRKRCPRLSQGLKVQPMGFAQNFLDASTG